MKILQVNKFFFAEYGTEKYMFALCDLLQKKRTHHYSFFHQRPAQPLLPAKQIFCKQIGFIKGQN